MLLNQKGTDHVKKKIRNYLPYVNIQHDVSWQQTQQFVVLNQYNVLRALVN